MASRTATAAAAAKTASRSRSRKSAAGQSAAKARTSAVRVVHENEELEERALSSSLGKWVMWNPLVLGGSSAGITLGPSSAMTVAALRQGLSIISDDLAGLPLDLYRRIDDQDRQIAREHPAWWLVRHEASGDHSGYPQSANDLWRRAVVSMLFDGNGYVYIERAVDGRPLRLINVEAHISAELVDGNLYYVYDVTGERIPARDMIHLKPLCQPGQILGDSLWSKCRQTLSIALAADGFSAAFFENGGRPGGILFLTPGTSPDREATIKKLFNRTGKDAWFSLIPLGKDAEFKELTMTPQDGELLGIREQQVREVARILNISPSLLGVSDSVSYNSKSEDNAQYYQRTLSPIALQIAAECNLKLLTPEERRGASGPRLYFEHNTDSLLRMDTAARAQIYAMYIRNGIASPDECRGWENMGRRPDGQGDQFVDLTQNVGATSDGGVDKQPADGASTKKGSGKSNDAMRTAFQVDIEDAWRKKAAKGRQAFGNWIRGLAQRRSIMAQPLDLTDWLADIERQGREALTRTDWPPDFRSPNLRTED